MTICLRTAVAAIAIFFSAAAPTQEYPTRLIRILNAAGPDAVARMVAEKLQAAWGQPVIVENRLGAGGMVMAREVASAPPNGYTLMFCASSQFMAIPFYKIDFDMNRDIAPITQVTTMPFILSVHPSVPVNSVKELIALAKSKPGVLNYASSGMGTPPHLVAEMFNFDAGTRIFHVSYKTIAQASTDLIGGHVQVMFVVATAAAPLMKADKIRALAVSTGSRSPLMPNIPTIDEAAGLSGFSADAWNGFCAPAGMPGAVVARLHGEITRIVRMPDVEKRIIDLGNTVVGSSPEEFGAFMKSERDKWAKVAATLGVKPE
jgi:tripartite-type tricarboxylate transporter receptor subunit TctC